MVIPSTAKRINTRALLHVPMRRHWRKVERELKARAGKIHTRFRRAVEAVGSSSASSGDQLIADIRETFFHGLGIRWGEDQIRVFNAFIFSCLPLIYGETWNENKARVLKEWEQGRERPYVIVSMARRNGKTFVTSGTVVSLLLNVPRLKVAIFSTCKRTSQMMMSAIVDMLEQAFELGTHVNRQDFVQVMKNTEKIVFVGPDNTKRELGCYPGSVRVSRILFGVCV